MLKAIWAMTEDRLVGKDNSLPWRIKEELAHFRRETLNKNILVGKNTYLSLPDSFDQRNIFVLSRDINWKAPKKQSKTTVINDYRSLIEKYKGNKSEDLYVCGGISIYEQITPLCDELIVSIIKGKYEGNRYLPEIDLRAFKERERIEYEEFSVIYYTNEWSTE